MHDQKRFLVSVFSMRGFLRFLALGLGLCLSGLAIPPRAMAQIPATQAFENPPVCSDSDLTSFLGDSDLARGNPEWKSVNGLTIDPLNPGVAVQNDQPTILEGTVPQPPTHESSTSQAPSEVSEEEVPWNHYTHDFTFKVVPDPVRVYQDLLSSWVRFPGVILTIPTDISPELCKILGGTVTGTTCVLFPAEKCPDGSMGTTCQHTEMEVEWENGSVMKVKDDDDRVWGAVPEFVWPAVGDRVWVEGRWVFDCGHPRVPKGGGKANVQFQTEIHPPRALVTFRLNHPALSTLPPSFPSSTGSWLPVTGAPAQPNGDPTHVPVTEADIFLSGNGGGANDLCMLEATNSNNDCQHGHTNPVITVGDRNYVFDIYPPGTGYYGGDLAPNGTFLVTPPVQGASLQWRTVDHSSELPAHTCPINNACITTSPIFCLLDASTPPPDQSETGCPPLPPQPTRLRVILPFHNPDLNYFAQSVLLGWDDVPAPPNTLAVRTFRVSLHKFTVKKNGESFLHDGDWRVFVNVGGQYRYMSPLFDAKPDGTSVCNGADALTNNGDDDCFMFDKTPWFVSVEQGTPIHVGVGGFESDSIDSDYCGAPDNRIKFPYPGGCQPLNNGDAIALVAVNDDRIGTYEFDLKPPEALENYTLGYTAPVAFTTQNTGDNCALPFPLTCDELQYTAEFRVREVVSPAVPTSFPFRIGEPHFNNYVTSATPLVLTAASGDFAGFQYRFHRQGHPLPTFASPLPFPVHWTHADLPGRSHSVPVYLNYSSPADGPYDLQYSAETFAHRLEPRHTASLILDNTPPVVGIVQPKATTYPHSAVLTLDYSANDGTGSGVGVVTPLMDNISSLAGHGLQSGQAIKLLTELKLGAHTFKITAADKVDNTRTSSVTFRIIVTPVSIQDDVQQFLQSGAIKSSATAKSLLTQLRAAAAARAAGHCSTAATIYQTFIKNLNALSGKGVTAAAAAIMIADARYLIAHCP